MHVFYAFLRPLASAAPSFFAIVNVVDPEINKSVEKTIIYG